MNDLLSRGHIPAVIETAKALEPCRLHRKSLVRVISGKLGLAEVYVAKVLKDRALVARYAAMSNDLVAGVRQ